MRRGVWRAACGARRRGERGVRGVLAGILDEVYIK